MTATPLGWFFIILIHMFVFVAAVMWVMNQKLATIILSLFALFFKILYEKYGVIEK